MSKQKKIPKFKTEEQEQNFWKKNDSVDFVDWSQARLAQVPKLSRSVHAPQK